MNDEISWEELEERFSVPSKKLEKPIYTSIICITH